MSTCLVKGRETNMRLIGKGNTAEVFEYGEGKAYKLFYKGYPKSAIECEYANAKAMQQFELPLPHCYEMVECEGRIGIVYDKVCGKTALEYFLGKNDIEAMIHMMAKVHKQILQNHTHEVKSYKKSLIQMVEWKDADNKVLIQKIMELPDGDALCHGDYHPGNLLVNDQGKPTVIDFMNVCCGPWQYDVARSYFLISQGEVDENIPDLEMIIQMQKEIAKCYLKEMNLSYEEISCFIEVIEACRKYEK